MSLLCEICELKRKLGLLESQKIIQEVKIARAETLGSPRKMALNKNLDILLKRRNMTIAELSRKSGVPVKTLYHWRTGQRPVADERIFNVADALRVGIGELLFG